MYPSLIVQNKDSLLAIGESRKKAAGDRNRFLKSLGGEKPAKEDMAQKMDDHKRASQAAYIDPKSVCKVVHHTLHLMSKGNMKEAFLMKADKGSDQETHKKKVIKVMADQFEKMAASGGEGSEDFCSEHYDMLAATMHEHAASNERVQRAMKKEL